MKSIRLLFVAAAAALASVFSPFPVGSAGAWDTCISAQPSEPELFIGIDKSSQTFLMFAHKSPLRVLRRLACATGEVQGDKTREGDRRTPEGVYFVGGRVSGRLNYELYGNYAYSLDFPNPVDRLKGKTGHGIWIHGRGKSLKHDTLGCVALSANDIKSLEGRIPIGTPVVIARRLTWNRRTSSDRTGQLLAERVRQWANDWQNKRERFFDYFQRQKFSRTEGVSFAAFRSRKLAIFAHQPWINVMVDNVRAIQGPDYWVTTFDQFYRTRDLVSTMNKRFYWQRDRDGVWRIIGGEYRDIPAAGLTARYLAGRRGEVKRFLDGWLGAWLKADIDKYMTYYATDAASGDQRGARAIREYKKSLWAGRRPKRITAEKLSVSLHREGLRVAFLQDYADTAGLSDRGLKTLILAPKGDGWIIENESWEKR